ncbi:hypothetical protein RB213_011713 [Colletotrichum asianum]
MATVLPTVFASVVGRLMSEGARWRLERGASVELSVDVVVVGLFFDVRARLRSLPGAYVV